MDAACLRYLEVLDVNCANAGAVHNWGMVLQAQGNISRYPKRETEDRSRKETKQKREEKQSAESLLTRCSFLL